MKITSIDAYRLPQPTSGKSPVRVVAVRVNTDEGISGFGEVGLSYGAGSGAGLNMLLDLAPYVIGLDPFNVEAIWEHLFRKTFWAQGGGPVVYGAMSAIDCACWDIKGKAVGLPVYKLLGGKTNPRLRTYASQIQADWAPEHRFLSTPEEFAEAALKAIAEGFDCVKLDPLGTDGYRIGGLQGTLSAEQIRLYYNRTKAVRDAVGAKVDIIVEAHAHLGINSAIQLGRALGDLDCMFYEEPIHPLNADDMVRVANNVPIPLASGERIYTRWGFRPFLEKQALGLIQPDLGLCGGFTEGKKICDMANAYDVRVQCHVCGGPISTAIALHLETVIPNFTIHEWHVVALQQDVIAGGLYNYTPKNGYFEVPELPGIGQELSAQAMRTADHARVG